MNKLKVADAAGTNREARRQPARRTPRTLSWSTAERRDHFHIDFAHESMPPV